MPSEQTKCNLSGETGRPSNPEDPAMPHSPESPAGNSGRSTGVTRVDKGQPAQGLGGNRPLEVTTHRPLAAPQLRSLLATADAPKQTRKPGLPLPSSPVPARPGAGWQSPPAWPPFRPWSGAVMRTRERHVSPCPWHSVKSSGGYLVAVGACGQGCPGQRAPLQGSAVSRPSSREAPGLRTARQNPRQQHVGMDTGPAPPGSNPGACFLNSFEFALLSPCCSKHLLPPPCVSRQSPLLALLINSASAGHARGEVPPGLWLEEPRLRGPAGRAAAGFLPSTLCAQAPTPLSRLFHSGLHPAILLAPFRMSVFHNGKQKPYNAQLPTFHCVLIALLTARSTTQEQ